MVVTPPFFNKLDLAELVSLHKAPEPFTPGERLFWDDPHISAQMLAAHLDPESDLASRKPETIDACVAWITAILGLDTRARVLDQGCGPGLYAARLAARGLTMTGVDLSRRSIDYARAFAAEGGLAIDYRCQDYLTLTDENQYEVVLLVFGDYCTFNPEDRMRLLGVVHRALRPGGHFVLDVTTRLHRARNGLQHGWYASKGGFWRPGRHLVLEQGFDYPDKGIWLDQYIVVEESGSVSVYRNWFQDYDRAIITAELAKGGFAVQHVWGDLAGTPFSEESEWIGLAAKRGA